MQIVSLIALASLVASHATLNPNVAAPNSYAVTVLRVRKWPV